jgi:hypothetical protein
LMVPNHPWMCMSLELPGQMWIQQALHTSIENSMASSTLQAKTAHQKRILN